MEATFSHPTPDAARTAKQRYRAGIAVSALPVLFLLFDCAIKLVKIVIMGGGTVDGGGVFGRGGHGF